MRITTKMMDELLPYRGPELRPHFLLETWRLSGSAVAGFLGPCEVATGDLVDWEDRLAGDFIRSKLMLHFLGEFFGSSLEEGVLYQRIFMSIAAQEIALLTGERIVRSGDDLFWMDPGSMPKGEKTEEWAAREGRKLSVSIVTASPVSRLLHVGINIDATGAPVRAAGLMDLGIVPRGQGAQDLLPARDLGARILRAFSDEIEGVEWACAKVRPVV
jgi:hypothetical protein